MFAGIILVKGGVDALSKAILFLKGTALFSWVTQQIALMNTFGLSIYGAAAAQGALAKATLFLKGVLIGLPWAALAAAIGHVGVKLYEAHQEQKEWNRLIREGLSMN